MNTVMGKPQTQKKAEGVGVLGGGLQGCCAALALAERGVMKMVLFDRNPTLLERTAVSNEDKIHLGRRHNTADGNRSANLSEKLPRLS